MVVDEAGLLLYPAAGGVLECVCAGQPVTVCILEPVFYNCTEGFGGKTVVPPRSADAVAHFPHAVRVVETGPGVALRFGGTGCENTDGPKHLPGGLFHNAPLVVISIRVEQCPCGQQFAGLFGVFVRLPPQVFGHLRVVGPVRVHHPGVLRGQAAQDQPLRFDLLCACMAHGSSTPIHKSYA